MPFNIQPRIYLLETITPSEGLPMMSRRSSQASYWLTVVAVSNSIFPFATACPAGQTAASGDASGSYFDYISEKSHARSACQLLLSGVSPDVIEHLHEHKLDNSIVCFDKFLTVGVTRRRLTAFLNQDSSCLLAFFNMTHGGSHSLPRESLIGELVTST